MAICKLTAYVPASLKYLVVFISYSDPKKHCYPCVILQVKEEEYKWFN